MTLVAAEAYHTIPTGLLRASPRRHSSATNNEIQRPISRQLIVVGTWLGQPLPLIGAIIDNYAYYFYDYM